MRINRLCLSFLLLHAALLSTAQGLKTAERWQPLLERGSLLKSARLLKFDNPALMTERYDSALTLVAGTYEYARNGRYIMQQGNGHSTESFNAESYTRLGPRSVVWGNALYSNGRTTRVGWNETSDFELVYPYVTADTIGGAMQSETYYFQGGYAHSLDRLSYGVRMAYRSVSAYRTKDPRPKNDVGMVNAAAGLAWRFMPGRTVGAYFLAEKYSQNQSITFMNPRGTVMIYHMTGLATDYVRFGGNNSTTVYNGHTLAAGLTLASTRGTGPEGSIGIERYTLQKRVVLTNTYLPLNDISQTTFSAEGTWTTAHSRARLRASSRNRTGRERIYDDGTHNYHEIASSEPFRNKVFTLTGEWAFEQSLGGDAVLGVRPVVTYVSDLTTYVIPRRRMDVKTLLSQLDIHFARQWYKFLLDAGTTLYAETNLRGVLDMDETTQFPHGLEAVNHNYEALTAGGGGIKLYVSLHVGCRGALQSVFIRPEFEYSFYNKSMRNRKFMVALGITI